MHNLQKRLKGQNEEKAYLDQRVSIRERLLAQEVKDLENLQRQRPPWQVSFPKGVLHEMSLVVTPTEGMYKGGVFRFSIIVPHEYNNVPPQVKCLTKVWHPNINEEGNICLSLLRENSLDQFGWRPTRNILEVVMGLSSLFTDLIDFDDPLNAEAAKQYSQNKDAFQSKVRDYIQRYARPDSRGY